MTNTRIEGLPANFGHHRSLGTVTHITIEQRLKMLPQMVGRYNLVILACDHTVMHGFKHMVPVLSCKIWVCPYAF